MEDKQNKQVPFFFFKKKGECPISKTLETFEMSPKVWQI